MEPLAAIKSSENTVTGTIREEFMSETIASFQMRLGSDGLDNVTILGIREVAENKQIFRMPQIYTSQPALWRLEYMI